MGERVNLSVRERETKRKIRTERGRLEATEIKVPDYIMDILNFAKSSQNSRRNALDQMQEVSKRSRRPYRVRSGGMSLCLWKVCPAAPWLIRRN
ncbi:hypothetical protein RRG08_014148 [Elysia crispata]|uniref:Uncharacterized protein n=1 Tax=Elysia crispata TaxID=231223 RepID=A0AAE1DYB2_9GAST|nr:hypothetical protein RRG08_014148 [Elysia crispata]